MLLVLGAVGMRGHSAEVRTSGSPVNIPGVVLSSTAQVAPFPTGFYAPSQIVADPSGAGVWFLAEDSSGPSLFHWSPGQASPQSWRLPTKEGLGGKPNGLAAGTDGYVWAGLGDQLFELDTAQPSRAPILLALPPVSDAPLAEHELPGPLLAGVQAIHPVVGVATDSRGDVAVARQDAAAIQIFHRGGGIFDTVELPGGTTASSLALDSSGTLGVGLDDYNTHVADSSFFLVQPGGVSQTLQVPASSVQAQGTNFIVGSAVTGIYRSIAETSTADTSGAVKQLPSNSSTGVSPPGSTLEVANGHEIYPTVSGIAVVGSAGVPELFRLPRFNCSASSFASMDGPPPSSGSAQCDAFAKSVSVDGAGNIWYLSSAPGNAIGYITPVTYGS